MLSSENNGTYSKKYAKKQVCLYHEIIRLITMKMKMKMKNGSHRYDINRVGIGMDTNMVNVKSALM